MAKLLYTFGGLTIPNSMIVLKDLKPLYTKSIAGTGCMVGETLPESETSSYTEMFPNYKILGCKRECPVMKEYVGYLEVLNSRDYTAEIDFCGDINRFLYNLTMQRKMTKVSGCLFGVEDTAGNVVNVDRLLGTTYIDFDPRLYTIYLPENQLLKRTKYGWFLRLSQSQLRESPTVASKWLIIAQRR